MILVGFWLECVDVFILTMFQVAEFLPSHPLKRILVQSVGEIVLIVYGGVSHGFAQLVDFRVEAARVGHLFLIQLILDLLPLDLFIPFRFQQPSPDLVLTQIFIDHLMFLMCSPTTPIGVSRQRTIPFPTIQQGSFRIPNPLAKQPITHFLTLIRASSTTDRPPLRMMIIFCLDFLIILTISLIRIYILKILTSRPLALFFLEGRAGLALLRIHIMVFALLLVTYCPPYGFPVLHEIGELVRFTVFFWG